MHSLVNKITFKRQIGINLISKRSRIFSDFPPSKIVGPTLSNFRRLLYYSSVVAAVVKATGTVHFRFIPTRSVDFQLPLNPGETAPLNKVLREKRR